MKPSRPIHTSSGLPQIFCQLFSYQHLVLIPTLRCSGKKTYATRQHKIPPSVLLSTSELRDAFLPAKETSGRRHSFFPPSITPQTNSHCAYNMVCITALKSSQSFSKAAQQGTAPAPLVKAYTILSLSPN